METHWACTFSMTVKSTTVSYNLTMSDPHRMTAVKMIISWLNFTLLLLAGCGTSWAQDSALEGGNVADPNIDNCHAWTRPSDDAECGWEPNLQPMTVNFGNDYNETFYAYVTPDVSSFYNYSTGELTLQKPTFTGLFGKFINLSPHQVQVYWDPAKPGQQPSYISDIAPFESAGTATYPSHQFIVTPVTDPSTVLQRWTMQADNSLYYYDPYEFDIQKAAADLPPDQLSLYQLQLANKVFAEQYRPVTGRDWLALYKQKMPPRFHMWRADAMGQTYTVSSRENHFEERPDQRELTRGTSVYGPRPDERQRLRRYRARDPLLNLTLTVLSCAPRVFEIRNFLSDVEVEHLLQLAATSKMQRSSVQASEGSQVTNNDVRTSTNSWIARNADVVVDAIYRRAADLLQMNEALLRWRRQSELPEFPESMISVAERLQMVNYQVGQQYTPHHDFTMPGLVHMQPSRFATILFYLNDDGLEGGETSFPKWRNADTSDALKVKPEKGKAILFYSLLPDGNYDELSIHAAMAVNKGEKFLTNLWVWDPVLDHTAAAHI